MTINFTTMSSVRSTNFQVDLFSSFYDLSSDFDCSISLIVYNNHKNNVTFAPEPMGKVSPKFPSLEKSRLFNFETNQTISVLCPAQAFPTPMFR